jgi:pimeloyl-ACP methyl ester carboxylesterase
VLLHGQPDSSASFWALRRSLRARVPPDVRIGAPDRPGYGANRLPATDFEGNVRWLNSWLARAGAGPTILVGHSWAGGVAILSAAANPAIVGLVLLASIGPFCLLPIDPVLSSPGLGEVIAFASLGLGKGAIGRRASRLLTAHLDAADAPFARASGFAMLRRPIWRSFLTEQRALTAHLQSVTAALPRVSVPTTIMRGVDDHTIPERTAAELAAGIDGARRVEMAGGHDLQLRQPNEVAAEIAMITHAVHRS